MLHAAVVGIGLAGDEPARLEPVDEPGDVRVVAGEDAASSFIGSGESQLQQRPGLRGVQLELGGRDEEAPALAS